MANQKQNAGKSNDQGGGRAWFSWLTIVGCLIICFLLFINVFGHPSNFENGDPSGEPLPGAYLGMAYKGGYVIAVLMSMFLMVITFSIERGFVLSKAMGTGSLNVFVRKVQSLLRSGDIDGAISLSDRQKGSVANVVKSALTTYKSVESDSSLDKGQRQAAVQKEIEECTVLEMPMLQQNMNIVAALVSLGTLVGLLGTVMGMIRAFNALATSGAPDQAQLASGISEALFNTATGIGTSALAIIAYNFFMAKIDKMTFYIDEVGFSINQTFNSLK